MSEERRYRIEKDSMGEVKVPEDKYWGAQTQRSLENFRIGEKRMPLEIIRSYGAIKKACAMANMELGILDEVRGNAIVQVADEIIAGDLDDQFPLVVYQTGSGTQTNMNLNEVIANRGNEILAEDGNGEVTIHPNDHVNLSQSSNDTFPSAMSIAALSALEEGVVPEIEFLIDEFGVLSNSYTEVIKIGRTHLQDAAPLTLGQEISAWASMLAHDLEMIQASVTYLRELPLGGTAVGTGLNSPEGFGDVATRIVSEITGKDFVPSSNKFHGLTSKDAFVFAHGAIKALASDLFKIANDIRMLASGPRCGIGELVIPENEPGSSIMPGKVNPTQCEALTMVCTRVMGNDAAIGFAASQGHYQLNVFMPEIISSFLESTRLMGDAMRSFRVNLVTGLEANQAVISENLEKSLMLVTALSPEIGYDRAAEIAKVAHNKGITLKEAGVSLGYVTEEEFDKLVKPETMI